MLTGWFYILSPHQGQAKHLQVDADSDKENMPGMHRHCLRLGSELGLRVSHKHTHHLNSTGELGLVGLCLAFSS